MQLQVQAGPGVDVSRTEDEFGHRLTKVTLDPPRALVAEVESTTVVARQDKSVGFLPVGALVRSVEWSNLAKAAWVTVSPDNGATWYSNERATRASDVLKALGL